jgi:hypothetical protein
VRCVHRDFLGRLGGDDGSISPKDREQSGGRAEGVAGEADDDQLIEQDDPSQRPVASGHGGGHQLGLYLIRLAGKQLERVQSPCTATRWKFGFFIPPGSDRGRFSLSLRHCVIQAKHPVTPLGW